MTKNNTRSGGRGPRILISGHEAAMNTRSCLRMVAILTASFLSVLASSSWGQGVCPANPTPGKPQVCLRWTAAPLVNVYRAVLPGTENYILPPLAASVASPYVDTTVLPGTSYYYTAIQVLGGNLSAPSSEAGALIPVSPSEPKNFVLSVQ